MTATRFTFLLLFLPALALSPGKSGAAPVLAVVLRIHAASILNWQVELAFRAATHLRNPERLDEMDLDRPLLSRLRDLDEGALQRCCVAYLSVEQRAAVLVRRDSILARWN